MVTTQAPLLCPFSGAITVGLLPRDMCVFQRPYRGHSARTATLPLLCYPTTKPQQQEELQTDLDSFR